MTLEMAAIACNRFGLGARPGDLTHVADDPHGWLVAQITAETQEPASLAALPSTADDLAAFLNWAQSIGINPTKAGGGGAAAATKLAPGMTVEQSFVQVLGARYVRAEGARFQAAVDSDRPFFERWVRFWSNHFTVSAAKPECVALPPAFERDVIRRHAAGTFEDMLVASCRHPGMLVYLDNIFSIGPNSFLAHQPEFLPAYLRERMKGVNENLGREVMELHTLGARSGYTQADVRAMSLMLTGWSVRGHEAPAAGDDLFRFIAAAHEPGSQTLLGQTYAEEEEAQALSALHTLAHHPATADHLATRLVRHFIADDPPPDAVASVSAAFRQSGGDLPTVARVLVQSPEAWTPSLSKFKPPEAYLISAKRALGGPPLPDRAVVALLSRMGQRPNSAPGPDGWPDVEAAWVGADPLWKRLEWATAASKATATAQTDPAALGDAVLGPWMTSDTRQAIRAAESPAQGLAILLVSPEFQRR